VSDKPVIFISYSHLHMTGGADWNPEIEKQLRECDVFVLLVSAHSMASDYVIDKEIGIVRERQARGDSVHFYPIVLTPTPRAGLGKVKDKNLRPRDGVPLSRVADRLQAMSDIADEIAEIIAKLAKEKVAAAPKKPKANAGIKIEIGGLPETPYVNLVGRDGQLKQLDAAWDDEHINVISLVAEGGAGKSSLLNEWLTRLQTRGYAGAEAVLGWSFYSQGSKERATSAEGFLSWAVSQLGVTPSSNMSSAKATAVAEALANRRIVLALDGAEPLQHGPGPELGKLKDLGLRELLRRAAANAPSSQSSMIVITTRSAVIDIDRWRKTSAPVIELDKLNDVAGSELLKDNGVWGTAAQLKETVEAFDGHALALSLVAGFLRETQNGDVRRRDHIKQIAYDDDDPRHAHAKRVIKSYADEWLANEPVLDSIMSLVGLFDRPADAGCLRALRRKPTTEGLTDSIVGLSDEDWNKAVTRLRAARLLLPPDPTMPEALDAHPLVREWFGARLRKEHEEAWRELHGRLYEHLRDTTKEGAAPTLEQLAPLYQAVAHGCCSGRYDETLRDVLRTRICRVRNDGQLQYYSSKMLGASSSDLAAVGWFFEKPYQIPLPGLSTEFAAWVLGVAARGLLAQGRLLEAVGSMETSLSIAEQAEQWQFAAVNAANLSEIKLLGGDVASAVQLGDKAVQYARRGAKKFVQLGTLVIHAVAAEASGLGSDADRLFESAERVQRKLQPQFPKLYATQGSFFCNRLIAKRAWASALHRAAQSIRWGGSNPSLLSRAFDAQTLARASLGALLEGTALAPKERPRMKEIEMWLEQAIDGCRAAGASEHLPRGLLARVTSRRGIGHWTGATRDLDEVEEIAEPGPMRLFLCDLALERARLAFARIEAFAPLNGMLEKDNPPKPEVPSKEEIVKLKAEAEKQIKIADDYIQTCGYHRRDEELAELKAVLKGEKMFASLPPRV